MKGEARVMAGRLKRLKIYGIMYFIFACANALNMLIGVLIGTYSAMNFVNSGIMGESLATLTMMIYFVITVLVIGADLCLALKGYIYGIGEGFGYAHVSVSRLLPIALFIQLGLSVLLVYSGVAEYVALITAFVGLCTVFNYNKCARLSLEG